jgi:hypothetical protein
MFMAHGTTVLHCNKSALAAEVALIDARHQLLHIHLHLRYRHTRCARPNPRIRSIYGDTARLARLVPSPIPSLLSEVKL